MSIEEQKNTNLIFGRNYCFEEEWNGEGWAWLRKTDSGNTDSAFNGNSDLVFEL